MLKRTSLLAALICVSAPASVLADPPDQAQTPATQAPRVNQSGQTKWIQINSFSHGMSQPASANGQTTGRTDTGAVSPVLNPVLKAGPQKAQAQPPPPKPKKKKD
jgi:hypothetical protein